MKYFHYLFSQSPLLLTLPTPDFMAQTSTDNISPTNTPTTEEVAQGSYPVKPSIG
jgi:hypothetical protein